MYPPQEFDIYHNPPLYGPLPITIFTLIVFFQFSFVGKHWNINFIVSHKEYIGDGPAFIQLLAPLIGQYPFHRDLLTMMAIYHTLLST
jgi:hypothetical protein